MAVGAGAGSCVECLYFHCLFTSLALSEAEERLPTQNEEDDDAYFACCAIRERKGVGKLLALDHIDDKLLRNSA